jgi:DNA-binding GntR family transcriptional regulator
MTETGDRGGPASHHPRETGDDPSATVRQPVLRPRGIYVSKSDMVTDVLRDLITDGRLSPGAPLGQLLLLMRLLWRSFPHGPQAGRPHQESVRQHDALVRALKHRNEEQVAAIIRDHVLGSIKYLPQR